MLIQKERVGDRLFNLLTMASYFLELPGTGIKAEVEAPSTRSAQTTYLDYLTRNKIVPWKGRNALRPSIVTDRIESGQMDVDINLNYNLESGGVEETSEVMLGGPQFVSSPIETVDRPPIAVSKTDIPKDVPTTSIGNQMPIQVASKRRFIEGNSKIGNLSRRTLGKGRF